MVCHEYFTILLRNLHQGIEVESSLSASPHHGVRRLVVLISRVFLLLYKQEHSALQLDVISGCLLMILKTD